MSKITYSDKSDIKETDGTIFYTNNVAKVECAAHTTGVGLTQYTQGVRVTGYVTGLNAFVYASGIYVYLRTSAARVWGDFSLYSQTWNKHLTQSISTDVCRSSVETETGFSSTMTKRTWGEVTHREFGKYSVAVNTVRIPILTLNIAVSGRKGARRQDMLNWAGAEVNWVVLNQEFKDRLAYRLRTATPFPSMADPNTWCNDNLINRPPKEAEFNPLNLLKQLGKYETEKKYVLNMDKFLKEMNATAPDLKMGVKLKDQAMSPDDLFDSGGGVVINAVDIGRQVFNFTQEGWRQFTFGAGTAYWFNRQGFVYVGGRSVSTEDDYLLVRGKSLWHFECLGQFTDSDEGVRSRGPESAAVRRYEGTMTMEVVKCSGDGEDKKVDETLMSFEMSHLKEVPGSTRMVLMAPEFKFVNCLTGKPTVCIEMAELEGNVSIEAENEVELISGMLLRERANIQLQTFETKSTTVKNSSTNVSGTFLIQ